MKFDYSFASGKSPFNVTAIYHDAKFTYIKSDATEKFAVYEVRDGSPNIVNYELRNGTYIIAKVLDAGYFEVGKKKMEFSRKVQP
jgi:type IV secretion system protein VirB9